MIDNVPLAFAIALNSTHKSALDFREIIATNKSIVSAAAKAAWPSLGGRSKENTTSKSLVEKRQL